MGGGQRLHTAMHWMIQRGRGLEIPGSTIDLFGYPACLCFSVYRLRYLCAQAIYRRVSYLDKFGFARSEVTDLREIVHSGFLVQWISKRPEAFD